MSFFKRLFGRDPSQVIPPAPVAPTLPAPSKSNPRAGPFQGPSDDDITLIDPVANDAWQAGVFSASEKKTEHKDGG